MADDNSLKVRRNDEAVWRVINGEIVVLIPKEVEVHALTGCGGRIWELIEGEIAISEIIQRIAAEYEVEPQKAAEEVTAFIHKLERKKLLEISRAAGGEASL
jgi:hypothetical protein